ncbi:YfaZ family outer membrane protein [Craterilacuibacter sp.]|uniref:YfaZ family outer membrane protein n=1 Tax=Craterilacuibacter sp. TaxID=2870909 RepID=UPI003F374BC4
MLKKTLLAAVLATAALPALAGDLTVAATEHGGFISRTATGFGPGITLDYLQSDEHGTVEAGGVGLTFSLPVPFARVDLGGKAMWVDAGGQASAGMLGGRVTVDLPFSTEAFVQGYWAPESAASGSVSKVSDTMAGLRWKPLPLIGVEAGWREFKVERNDSRRDRKIADGAYLGASIGF